MINSQSGIQNWGEEKGRRNGDEAKLEHQNSVLKVVYFVAISRRCRADLITAFLQPAVHYSQKKLALVEEEKHEQNQTLGYA
jgi:hypothetical protein